MLVIIITKVDLNKRKLQSSAYKETERMVLESQEIPMLIGMGAFLEYYQNPGIGRQLIW